MTYVQKTYCVAICLLLINLTLNSASSIQQEDENNKRTIFEEVSQSLEGDEETLNSLTEKLRSASEDARDTTLEKVLQRLEVAERRLETAERKLEITEDKLVVAEREIKELKTTGSKCEDSIDQRNLSRRQEHDESAVGFTACISPQDLKIVYHQAIIFDRIITNVGNAYHPNTGLFIAPFKGMYVFHLAVMQAAGHSMYLQIMKNGAVVDDVFVDAMGLTVFQSVSEHWVLELDKGQEVWIQPGNYGQIHGFCYTSFSGFLLKQLM